MVFANKQQRKQGLQLGRRNYKILDDDSVSSQCTTSGLQFVSCSLNVFTLSTITNAQPACAIVRIKRTERENRRRDGGERVLVKNSRRKI